MSRKTGNEKRETPGCAPEISFSVFRFPFSDQA